MVDSLQGSVREVSGCAQVERSGQKRDFGLGHKGGREVKREAVRSKLRSQVGSGKEGFRRSKTRTAVRKVSGCVQGGFSGQSKVLGVKVEI